MQNLVIYGKGGIGKSTIAASLSEAYALSGRRVLHVGCDPKHDSAMRLVPGGRVPTVLERLLLGRRLTRAEVLTEGRHGIHCVEAGGPEPGTGCGGRGVAKMMEVLAQTRVVEEGGYDLAVFDVLGDVVCGGFAAPLKAMEGQKVVIVVSEELMALYAANNIAKAVCAYRYNGARLAGLVMNLRDNHADLSPARWLADTLGTRILAVIPRSRDLRDAEFENRTILDTKPDGEIAGLFRALAEHLWTLDPASCADPTPLDSDTFLREAGARVRAFGD
jgi:nitrogenase iron protein NifH